MCQGESWIYVKFYIACKQQNAIIAEPLPKVVTMLQKQGLIDCWFFVRDNAPEPHLRLRFHACNMACIQTILMTLLEWCHQNVQRGLGTRYTLAVYEREVERYGGPMAIDLAEQVFSIDSLIISKVIASIQARHLTLGSIAIAVFMMDHFLEAWGLDSDQRLQWVRDHTDKYTLSKEFQPYRKLYCELLSPEEYQLNTQLMSQRKLLYSLVKPEEASLRALADQIRTLAAKNELELPEEEILKNLIHMRKIRLTDLDPQKELVMYAFWRHSLESLSLQPVYKKVSIL